MHRLNAANPKARSSHREFRFEEAQSKPVRVSAKTPWNAKRFHLRGSEGSNENSPAALDASELVAISAVAREQAICRFDTARRAHPGRRSGRRPVQEPRHACRLRIGGLREGRQGLCQVDLRL